MVVSVSRALHMPAATVKLWFSLNDESVLALSIPLDRFGVHAVTPLKWLRFLGYSIYGREGYLSESMDGQEILDYTANVQARSYYFVSERRLITDLLHDPGLCRPNT